MIFLIRLVLKTFVQLFPRGIHRNRAILLATVATIVPLSQLFVIRIFSQMILDGPTAEVASVVLNFALFFGLFGLSHLATFWQKTHRVKVFNDALKSREGKRTRMTESWEFALAFETNNLLHTFTQVAVLSTFFIVVNWQSGLINLGLILITMIFIKMTFKKQVATQEGFALAQKNKENIENVTKVRARVRSAEISSLFANAAFIVSLAALLAFSFLDRLEPADAVMLFLGFRMQNSNLTQTSGSLMRFARAKALSEAPEKYRQVKLDEDELG